MSSPSWKEALVEGVVIVVSRRQYFHSSLVKMSVRQDSPLMGGRDTSAGDGLSGRSKVLAGAGGKVTDHQATRCIMPTQQRRCCVPSVIARHLQGGMSVRDTCCTRSTSGLESLW